MKISKEREGINMEIVKIIFKELVETFEILLALVMTAFLFKALNENAPLGAVLLIGLVASTIIKSILNL